MRNPHSVANDRPEPSDALYDTSPRAMAERFGARTIQLLREGRDVAATARLAASQAFLADPSLREGAPTVPDLADHVWRLGTELNRAAAERVSPRSHLAECGARAIDRAGHVRAFCGALVAGSDLARSGEPTCPDCKRINDEDAALRPTIEAWARGEA